MKQTQVQVETALSGKELLTKVCQKHYDLIFIDHRMPIMDGIEAFHIMQELEDNKCQGVPCIALTANVVSGARENYMDEGFTDYLSKPIDSKQFEKMIMKYLPQEKVRRVFTRPDGTVRKEVDVSAPPQTTPAPQDDGPEALLENQPFDFCTLKGINLKAALTNCGSSEIFVEVLRDYLENIPARAENLARYQAEHDLKNYTVLVHAIKSSSRLIGALELSEQAAYLEQCGDAGNEAEIAEKTPALLKLFTGYIENLATAALPQLSEAEFAEALAALTEYASGGDLASCQGILDELANYFLPAGNKPFCEQLRRAVQQQDAEALTTLLAEHAQASSADTATTT